METHDGGFILVCDNRPLYGRRFPLRPDEALVLGEDFEAADTTMAELEEQIDRLNATLSREGYEALRMGFEPVREVDLSGPDDAKALAALRARAIAPIRPRRS